MIDIDKYITVNEAIDLMFANGVEVSRAWFNLQIWSGRIKSHKVFHSRVISRSEVLRLITEKRK